MLEMSEKENKTKLPMKFHSGVNPSEGLLHYGFISV